MKNTIRELAAAKISIENKIFEREQQKENTAIEISRTNLLRDALEKLNETTDCLHKFLNSKK